MISWASPWALLALPLVLALPAQRWLTGANRLKVPVVARVAGGWSLRRLAAPIPRFAQVIGLLLCVLAMARPRLTERETLVESDGLDILLVVDTSGSMEAEDLVSLGRPVNRLQVAKGVMADFIRAREHDRIGVVVFGQEAFTHVPLTLDHDTLLAALEHVEIGLAGPSSTAIGSAIAVGSRRLMQLEAPSRILILLTDGQNNAGEMAPATAARLAASVGIRVYTIGVGSRSEQGIDETALKAIAEATGARYFRATSDRELADVYKTIDSLERSPAEVRELVRHDELFRWLLVPGLLLLAFEALLSATWLRRGP